MKNKTYIMTGGTGFLGTMLSAELIKKGDKVIFLRRSKGEKSLKDRMEERLREYERKVKGIR